MQFVAIKTVDQQSMLSVHRLREGLKEERTACTNRIRGLLAEFGVVMAKSTTILRNNLSEVIEDASNELSGLARLVIQRAQMQWKELDEHIDWCDQRIAVHLKNGAQFGAWLGLTPKQNSSGGKNNLGSITKRGDMYVRSLLIQGAKSAVQTAHRRDDPISQWVFKLREKSGWQKAAVALANKNARILWSTNGAPLRGLYLGPHCIKNQCNKAVSRCAVCSVFGHRQVSRVANNTVTKERKCKEALDCLGSPSRCCLRSCQGKVRCPERRP